jgi:hypothetical protein
VTAVLISVVSVYYYLRIVVARYFRARAGPARWLPVARHWHRARPARRRGAVLGSTARAGGGLAELIEAFSEGRDGVDCVLWSKQALQRANRAVKPAVHT